MDAPAAPQRFIPLRRADLIALCRRAGPLEENGGEAFGAFCRLLEALLHFEYHRLLEKLKNAYAPFDPDADTQPLPDPPATPGPDVCQQVLVRELTTLLDAANYEPITAEDLRAALEEASLFKIRLAVDFHDFDQVLFFRRGERLRSAPLASWWGLRRRTITFTHFDRVLVFIKFRDQDYFNRRKRHDLPFTPGSTQIKLFRNVPKADLEMLFPNSQIRMQTIDKLIIGVPAAVSGAVILVTKLGASLVLLASLLAFWLGLSDKTVAVNQQHLVALGLGLGTLAGFLFKQVGKFKNRKIRFLKALTENLYFKNLDNNAGVLHHLTDAAEEEEFKEAVLAYLFLAAAPEGLSRKALDRAVETWLAANAGVQVDFEVDDALAKLIRWGLVQQPAERLQALPLTAAVDRLDRLWDGLFRYADKEAAA